MRIAFVTQPLDSVMPLRQNSIGVVVHNTARCLAAAHDVTIIAGSRYNPPSLAPDDNIRYHFVGDEPDTPILGFLEHFPNWIPQERVLESRFFYRIYAERVARLLAKGNYDWVHVVNYSQFLPVLHRAAPRSHFNLEMHSYWLSQFPAREIRRRLAAADLVTCVSDDVAEQARDAHPGLTVPIETVHNGCDVERFAAAAGDRGPERRTILFVGRISPEKGVHDLLDAMEKVLAEIPDARLVLIGPMATLPRGFIVDISTQAGVRKLADFYDGTVCTDYGAYLRARAARSALAGRVEFVEPVSTSELPARYAQADVLVNPSYSETFGLSLVEGMSSGMPVIGTAVGGAPEIVVPGETGFLTEPGDVDGLAAAMLACLGDAELCDRLGRNGRERARRKFTWEQRSGRLVELFAAADRLVDHG
ncbi:glycosyltransferase family 4 protein [bacterium]|nr:glycosyltransferase family 4 protein [bacterium]